MFTEPAAMMAEGRYLCGYFIRSRLALLMSKGLRVHLSARRASTVVAHSPAAPRGDAPITRLEESQRTPRARWLQGVKTLGRGRASEGPKAEESRVDSRRQAEIIRGSSENAVKVLMRFRRRSRQGSCCDSLQPHGCCLS